MTEDYNALEAILQGDMQYEGRYTVRFRFYENHIYFALPDILDILPIKPDAERLEQYFFVNEWRTLAWVVHSNPSINNELFIMVRLSAVYKLIFESTTPENRLDMSDFQRWMEQYYTKCMSYFEEMRAKLQEEELEGVEEQQAETPEPALISEHAAELQHRKMEMLLHAHKQFVNYMDVEDNKKIVSKILSYAADEEIEVRKKNG